MELKEINKLGKQNQGFLFKRTNFINELDGNSINREKIFYEEWKKENEENIRGKNFGFGILQDLFMKQRSHYALIHHEGAILIIKPRDRFIVATIIQWLGTNVGWCFLTNVVDKCGYKLVKKD